MSDQDDDVSVPGSGERPHTLTIDIGGSGTKLMVLDAGGNPVSDRIREKTPRPATPEAILAVIKELLTKAPAFDRVSVGFPGVVQHGVIRTAANLEPSAWFGFDLQLAMTELVQKPVKVVNDADLAGFGVMEGKGLELVLTFGTGLGVALFIDGRLVPNLELGHAQFEKGLTFEQRVCEAELERVGRKRWRGRVERAIGRFERLFNYDVLWIGGGSSKQLELEDLPPNVRRFSNVEGMRGGVRVWSLPTVG